MITRRKFLANSSLFSLSPFLPSMLLNASNEVENDADSRVLVVIQLDGGNDGLNTVVPITDDEYAKNRFETRIAAKDALRLDDFSSLHPSMKSALELFDDGRLNIVQAVGYPNPDRSHFRSMKIWQTTRFDEAEQNTFGWLGRTLDNLPHSPRESSAVYIGNDHPPIALWSRRSTTLSMSHANDLNLTYSGRFNFAQPAILSGDSIEQFVSRSVLSAYSTVDELKRRRTIKKSSSSYPDSKLAQDLKTVAELMKAEVPAKIFYTSLGGFDTHSEQQFVHGQLLSQFSNALKAFLNDLREHKLDDRVLVLAFSEFGRRVRENDSQGTDHGTAGPVFLAGPSIQPGIVGHAPDLKDLDDGDIKAQVDFRQVYATLLDDWLNVHSTNILGDKFDRLPLLKRHA